MAKSFTITPKAYPAQKQEQAHTPGPYDHFTPAQLLSELNMESTINKALKGEMAAQRQEIDRANEYGRLRNRDCESTQQLLEETARERDELRGELKWMTDCRDSVATSRLKAEAQRDEALSLLSLAVKTCGLLGKDKGTQGRALGEEIVKFLKLNGAA